MIDSFVTFKWRPRADYRSHFQACHVNTSFRMAQRNLPGLKKFICITDDREGLDPDIEVVDLWHDFERLRNPSWSMGPSCYRRLKIFSEDFGEIAGERFVCCDLDTVFTGDMRPLFDRKEDFVIWNPENRVVKYCASLMLVRAGALHEMWREFDPIISPGLTASMGPGFKGSDQGWISYWAHIKGRVFPTWTHHDGVWDWRNHIRNHHRGELPEDARIVVFCGKPDPWEPAATQASPWILDHYR